MKKYIILILSVSLWVVGSPQFSFAQHTEYYTRPIPMGVSISPTGTSPYIFAGTAGMLVRSISDPS